MSDKKVLDLTEKFDGLLNEAQEIKTSSEELTSHLECAGTCETAEDFFANVKDALLVANEIVKELKKTLKKNKGA
jgi:hypothetical protein